MAAFRTRMRETAGLLTAERLHAMKAGAVLVNVGRGSLAGTDDLVSALQDGHLGGAALDVFRPNRFRRTVRCGTWRTCCYAAYRRPELRRQRGRAGTIWHICMDNLGGI